MSYSVLSPCGDCKKNESCADGKIIEGARDIIHSSPRGLSDDSWHQGSGSIIHECNQHEKKEQEDN